VKRTPPSSSKSSTMAGSSKRILKELQAIGKLLETTPNEIPLLLSAGPTTEASVQKWTITIRGKPETPYENGVFHLEITFPEQYPFKAFNIRFLTKILHPYVDSQTGFVSLETGTECERFGSGSGSSSGNSSSSSSGTRGGVHTSALNQSSLNTYKLKLLPKH
jgi:hypothetical protein